MRRGIIVGALALALAVAALPASAQDNQTITVPFSDPSRSGVLKIEQTQGSIRVEAWDGAEVELEARIREDGDKDGDEDGDEKRKGLRRWGTQNVQLEVIEEDNLMRVETGTSWSKIVDLTVRVPRRTDLQLECIHSGDIHVVGVEGEHELSNTHGSIEALSIIGSVVAETTHGDVKVAFDGIKPGRSMAFSTFHGDVDVSLPEETSAEVRIDPGNGGEIYTNFDIQPVAQPADVREERDGKRYRVTVERETRGRINNGGAEMHFKTWSGAIYIRKVEG